MRRQGSDGVPLAIGFSAIVLLLLWTWIGVNSWQQLNAIYEEARVEIGGAQNVMLAHSGRTYQSVKNEIAEIDDWLASLPATATSSSLQGLAEKISRIQDGDHAPFPMRLIDSTDTVVWHMPVEPNSKAVYVGDREYVIQLRDKPPGTLFLSAPLMSRISGQKAMPVSYRASPNPLDIAYITVVVTEKHFLDAFRQLTDVAPAKVGILRSDGTILFVWPINEDEKGQIVRSTTDVIARQPAGTSGLLTLPSLDGSGTSLIGYARLTGDPLSVFVAIEEADLHSLWLRTISMPIFFAVLSSIVIGSLGYWLIQFMRRNAEEARKLVSALREAESANESKSHFLANMSHELRTPLNAIIGFSEVMTHEVFGPLGADKYRGYATDIRASGRHLLGIINEILDTAKLDSGKVELGDDRLDLRVMISECLNMIGDEARRKRIAIEQRLPADLPAIHMDPIHLKRVLINLLSNALKFTPAEGKVEISAARAPDGALTVAIRDTGIGIPPERIGELFKPFSQIEESLSRNHEGIGLGLVNTNLIITAYGGKVWLESDVGAGTTASFTLPAARLGN